MGQRESFDFIIESIILANCIDEALILAPAKNCFAKHLLNFILVGVLTTQRGSSLPILIEYRKIVRNLKL